jgi:hypothetical protein
MFHYLHDSSPPLLHLLFTKAEYEDNRNQVEVLVISKVDTKDWMNDVHRYLPSHTCHSDHPTSNCGGGSWIGDIVRQDNQYCSQSTGKRKNCTHQEREDTQAGIISNDVNDYTIHKRILYIT